MSKELLTATDRRVALQREDHDTLVRLEANVDNLVQEVRQNNHNYNKTYSDHEIRIRNLENTQDGDTGSRSGTRYAWTTVLQLVSVVAAVAVAIAAYTVAIHR